VRDEAQFAINELLKVNVSWKITDAHATVTHAFLSTAALGFAGYCNRSIVVIYCVLVQNDTLLVLPTAPSIPPKLNTSGSTLEDFRNRAFSLLSVAGMSGCCQVRPCCNCLYFSFIVSLPA
jgi:hypothetical protein